MQERPGTRQSSEAAPWWKGATIYQIYPRSFQDSSGDGVGDLPGIISRLPYVASLSVDGIWLSPFFTSPMADYGYDIADYCNVDPVFGTLADFDRLVGRAHALGLKVIVDQVYAHTSDRHIWFQESRASRHNPKADWYVWADPKRDGSPPNNWQSVFGGPAWTWNARRQQYFMHNFLREQPQLNGHNPAVQDALLNVARFWLDRGVDGFRLDAINFAMHSPGLEDNPPAPPGGPRTRPFDYQLRRFNQSHPGIIAFLERVRAVCDRYGAVFTVAEVGGPDPVPEMKAFTAGDSRLSSAYGFTFLYADQLTPQVVANAMADWPGAAGEGWPSWAFCNHDAPRWISRWAPAREAQPFARMVLTLLFSLRGNAFLYQGEELGLTQVEIPFEQLKDPEAIANWPLSLSRDGARTPMPWEQGAPGLGFTSGDPWLPFGADHPELAVDAQASDPASLLNLTRQLVSLRRAHTALRLGRIADVVADGQFLSFLRETQDDRLLCRFNFAAEPVEAPQAGRLLHAVNGADASGRFPPFGAAILAV
ncbi:MAG: alpha-amylase family glycosyl hydrolase [Thermaurantiacus sp.]